MKALVLRNGNMNVMADCIIYEGMTQRDEAEMFARQSEFVKKPGKNEEMKALYAAGDVEIIELKKAIESVGFIFDFSTSKMTNRIICCNQMLKIFRKAHTLDFIRFLEVIKNAWHGHSDSLRREIIGGMWIFYSTYKNEIDLSLLESKLSIISPLEIYRDGKLLKRFPGDTKYAYTIGDIYNLRQRRKLDLSLLAK